MRVYLAGPDVFLADALDRAASLKAVCARYGLTGVSPLDPCEHAIDPTLSEAFRIARCNEAHIGSSDALIANLTPFRGPSADCGTVFELGFMRALGRPVFGWSNDAALFAERTCAAFAAAPAADGLRRDPHGLAVEDFGLHDNLMVDGAIAMSGGTLIVRDVPAEHRWSDLRAFETCVAATARYLFSR